MCALQNYLKQFKSRLSLVNTRTNCEISLFFILISLSKVECGNNIIIILPIKKESHSDLCKRDNAFIDLKNILESNSFNIRLIISEMYNLNCEVTKQRRCVDLKDQLCFQYAQRYFLLFKSLLLVLFYCE